MNIGYSDVVKALVKMEIPDDFNWFAVLKDLCAGAPCTVEEHKALRLMAGNWVTCACGQLCKALPHDFMGAPQDKELHHNGGLFCDHIERREWNDALAILHLIEARSAKLLGLE